MKNRYFLSVLLVAGICNAQIINFPDANLKAKLLSSTATAPIAQNAAQANIKIDADSDGQISQEEAAAVYYLYIGFANIASMEGLQYFTNLRFLQCKGNLLTSLDLSPFTNLEGLNATANDITDLNLSGLTQLKTLECHENMLTGIDLTDLVSLESLAVGSNQLTAFDFSTTPSLKLLTCSNNQIPELDLSMLPQLNVVLVGNNLLTSLDLSHNALTSLDCSNNQLQYLNIKDGLQIPTFVNFSGNPTLEYVCVDDVDVTIIQSKIATYGYANCHFNSYCSFTPGGTVYRIKGTNRYDHENDGCDNDDFYFPYMRVAISNGTNSGAMIFDYSGVYSLGVQAGTHQLSPALENNSYFTVNPSQVTVSFPSQASPFIQDFCVTANGLHPDMEITAFPLTTAIPGEFAGYMIICKNKGTTTESGEISFTYDPAYMEYFSAFPAFPTQNPGVITWNMPPLEPFNQRLCWVYFSLNEPTDEQPLNSGDVLHFSASVTGDFTDETPDDNTMEIVQSIVNSFDPNDKTCLEGNVVSTDKIGEYVHYMIRFENTGTANAKNIVVKDMIDTSMFDIASLVPLHGSHPFTTKITQTNKVEFIFENIDLPFDDENNDGYVVFKIKTLPWLMEGDTFSNSASIYFDYNFPVVTAPANTLIQSLGSPDFDFANAFALYPNPANTIVNIQSKNGVVVKSVSVYNMLGQLLQVETGSVSNIDVSDLTSGNYLVKIATDNGSAVTRFIKN